VFKISRRGAAAQRKGGLKFLAPTSYKVLDPFHS
jgi:hypothetical protein